MNSCQKINSKSIHIKLASIGIVSEYNFDDYLQEIPVSWHADILKYQKFDDKRRSIVARLLLLDFLKEIKYTYPADLVYNTWGKPKLKNAPYFNWSHSANYVVFAWSYLVDLGVDVEKKKALEWHEFETTFNKEQWAEIINSKIQNEKFYYYWVVNEAIIKAIGMGLSFDVKEIGLILKNRTVVNNVKFRLKEIKVHPEYQCYLAFRDDQLDYNFDFQVYSGLKY